MSARRKCSTRQGYSTGPKPAPEEVEAYNKARAARLATFRHSVESKREIAEREARAEADWLAIDHREARRAAPAELAPVREDVARLRAAYERAQARLVELGAEMRAEAEAAERRIAETGAAVAAALLDGFDD